MNVTITTDVETWNTILEMLEEAQEWRQEEYSGIRKELAHGHATHEELAEAVSRMRQGDATLSALSESLRK